MSKFVALFALLIVFAAIPDARAQTRTLIITGFDNGGRSTDLGEDFGTWDGFPNDPTQSCKMVFATDDAFGKIGGKSLQLDYDVDSPNAAYNGFWLKIERAEIKGLDTLSFYVKGDRQKGFTTKIKIELKDKKHGKATFLVENITDQWQKISLTLDPRSIDKDQKKPFEEFVIVFDDINSRPKTGRLLIDQIEFSGSR